MARTIQSPGVEINEIDLTLRSDINVGTNVFIAGFSNQGPIDEVLQPTTISEFEQIYGSPTNSAENYFYHSVKNVLNSSPAKISLTRLPYGENKGEGFSTWRYSALAYPVYVKHLFSFVLSSYSLESLFVGNSGSGYTTLPNISLNNNANGLLTVKALTGDDGLGQNTFGITGVEILESFGLEVPPTFSIDPSYVIETFSISYSGQGYLSTPDIILTGSTYTNEASLEVLEMEDDGRGLFGFAEGTYVLTNSGSGLTEPPVISVTTDGASIFQNAVFVPNMARDYNNTNTFGVSSITVTFSGRYDGYEVDGDSVAISGGGNSTTKVLPTLDSVFNGTRISTFGIKSLNVISAGKGYNIPPIISLSTSSLFSEGAVINVVGNDGTATIYPFGNQQKNKQFSDNILNDTKIRNYGSLKSDEFTKESELQESYEYFGKTCYLGKPTHLELSSEEYESIKNNQINWTDVPTITAESFIYNTLGHAGMIILNDAQSTVNNKYEGYYIGAIDNSNYNPATEFNGIRYVAGIQNSLESTKSYTILPTSRLEFSLSADKNGNGSSVSEIMENLSNYDLSYENYSDSISFGIFKLRKDVFSKDVTSLNFSLIENYVGSIDFNREIGDVNGGQFKSFSIEKVSENSKNVNIILNPNLSDRYNPSSSRIDGNPSKKIRFLSKQLSEYINTQGYIETSADYIIRSGANIETIQYLLSSMGESDALFPLGIYDEATSSNKHIGNLPQKLERAFELVDNSDVYPIDIAIEGGLGTVFVNSLNNSSGLPEDFVDSTYLKGISSFYTTNYDSLNEEGLSIRSSYTSVANVLINAAEKQRKDFMVILDPLRNIFVQGSNTKIINSKKIWSPNAEAISQSGESRDGYIISNFSQHIYWPLRHQFGTINCSYATTYANWAQVVDSKSGSQIWIPFSGIAASIMANTDSNFQPWYAPAGFTRGIVTGVNDLGIYPKQKQRDQLYKISLNPVTFFPNEGFTVFGQKTLLKRPSAFDRINVRRLFLALEKATKDTAKFFVFEPNTLFTRTQVINVLSPIFENAKNTEGLYDYRIICDERNNTPDVIDNNELKIDIYIQPVRTAEFILVNFYATRTGTNFDELIGS